MSQLAVGMSKQNISPDKAPLLKPTGMGRKVDTIGVLDDIFAEALCIVTNDDIGILVTAETRYFPHPWIKRIRETVSNSIGIPEQHILFSSTHNHCSSPVAKDDSDEAKAAEQAANEKIINGIIKACEEAYATRRPAEIAVTTTELNELVGQNRRIRINNGTALNCWGAGSIQPFGHKFAQIADEDSKHIDILLVREVGKEDPFGIFTSYATHPHMYELPYFSGEFVGAAKRAIEARLPGICTMHANHTGGDLDIHSIHPMPDEHEAQVKWFQESVALMGQRFANAVVPALHALEYKRPEKLCFSYQSTEHEESKAPQPRFILNHMALDDIGFVSIPGELFHCFGREIHERNPLDHVFLMGYNGSGGMYTPPMEIFEQGAYEVMRGPDYQVPHHGTRTTGEEMTANILKTLQELSA